MSAEQLDEFHAHEALDRTWLLMDTFASHVAEHEYVQRDPKLAALAESATTALMALYQAIGRRHL